MPTFLYKLKDDTGRTFFGVTEGKDVQDVKKQFRSSEYYFISAKNYDPAQFAKIKLNLDNLLMFTHRLASLIEAGVPILLSLHILWKQSENKEVQIMVTQIRKKLEDGATLRQSFDTFPEVFPIMYLALISVAEVGAGLAGILKKLSQYLQDQREFVGRIKRATLYPLLVLGFAFLVLMGMFIFVVPTFQKVLLKLHVQLPALTKMLFSISSLVRNPLFLASAVVVISTAVFLYKRLRKTKQFGFVIDSWKLKMPGFKSIFYSLAVSRFARSLSLLIGSGVPLVTAVEVAKATVTNIPIENAISQLREGVMEGVSLYDAFKSTKMFPIMLVEMVGIGESTGKLPYLLEKVADHLDEEVDYKIHKMLTYLEIVLIIMVGAIVLVILLGIYFPIFTLQNTLRSL